MKITKFSTRLLSALLIMVMVLGVIPAMAFADSSIAANKRGSVTVTMMHEKENRPSMCDVMFAEKADVEIQGENAVFKLYVACPIPLFADLGEDETLTDFQVTYKGKTYTAESDIKSKHTMTVKADDPGFDLVKGAKITAQVLTLTLPKEALKETEIPAAAYVNLIMGMDVKFRMALTDLTWEKTEPQQSADKQGTATVTMMHEKQDRPSMCDVMFAEKANVEIQGENAVFKLRVAYPIPAFPGMGKDGTLKDFQVTYKGKTYTAESDIESKPTMIVKADNPGFGLVKGAEITAQVLTLTLPKEALEEAEIAATAFVNVIMGMNVKFRMALADLTWEETKPEPEKPEPEKPQPNHPAVDAVDQATGIKVHADENVFTEEVTLVVDPILKGENGYDAAAKAVESLGKKFQLFNIHFVNQNGEEVQPNGKVSISYPVPEGCDEAKLAVYRINEDGSKTKINGTLENGCYTVIQKSLSTYALVEESAETPNTAPTEPEIPAAPNNSGSNNPKTGDSTHIAALVSLLLVSCTAIALLAVGKKHGSVN